MNDTYKLQLRHGAENRNFSTRDEVIGYINGQLQYGGVSLLPYEPILFFYGADDAKNAIIMVGLPEGKTQNGNSYFLVDTADLKKQIESLDSQYDDILQALKDEDKKIWEAVEQESQDRGEKDAEIAGVVDWRVFNKQNYANKTYAGVVHHVNLILGALHNRKYNVRVASPHKYFVHRRRHAGPSVHLPNHILLAGQ